MTECISVKVEDRIADRSLGTVYFSNSQAVADFELYIQQKSKGTQCTHSNHGIKVFDSVDEYLTNQVEERKQSGLAKLTGEEKIALGLT